MSKGNSLGENSNDPVVDVQKAIWKPTETESQADSREAQGHIHMHPEMSQVLLWAAPSCTLKHGTGRKEGQGTEQSLGGNPLPAPPLQQGPEQHCPENVL